MPATPPGRRGRDITAHARPGRLDGCGLALTAGAFTAEERARSGLRGRPQLTAFLGHVAALLQAPDHTVKGGRVDTELLAGVRHGDARAASDQLQELPLALTARSGIALGPLAARRCRLGVVARLRRAPRSAAPGRCGRRAWSSVAGLTQTQTRGHLLELAVFRDRGLEVLQSRDDAPL